MLDNFVIDRVLENLTVMDTKIKSLTAIKASCEDIIPSMENKLNSIEETLTMIAESKEYLRKAIDIIYARSVGELNERLNAALKYIYYDRDLSVEMKMDDKRGKSLSIILKNENGEDISVKDGCGMGVKNVISCVLHSYYLLSKNSKILMVDEKYSNISKEYLPRFFEFIRKLCEATGLTLIIITHDPRFIELADKKYYVRNGEVSVE